MESGGHYVGGWRAMDGVTKMESDINALYSSEP